MGPKMAQRQEPGVGLLPIANEQCEAFWNLTPKEVLTDAQKPNAPPSPSARGVGVSEWSKESLPLGVPIPFQYAAQLFYREPTCIPVPQQRKLPGMSGCF